MDILQLPAPLLYAGVFVLGTLIGSFLNVVILRIPPLLEYDWKCQCEELLEMEGEERERPPGIIATRSKCRHCGHQIRPWENIPLVSYAILRGRCSNCSSRISPRYPLVELVTGLMFLITVWQLGFGLEGMTGLVFTSVLIAATGIDIDHQLLPDNLTIPLMWLGILLALFSVHTDLASSVIGAMAGYLVLWSIYHLFRLLTGKEGMGYGDFKLLAALGAWFGWQMLPVQILFSSVVGAGVGLILMGIGKLGRDKPMPFGPFIAAAGWISMIWGDRILNVYLRSGTFG